MMNAERQAIQALLLRLAAALDPFDPPAVTNAVAALEEFLVPDGAHDVERALLEAIRALLPGAAQDGALVRPLADACRSLTRLMDGNHIQEVGA